MVIRVLHNFQSYGTSNEVVCSFCTDSSVVSGSRLDTYCGSVCNGFRRRSRLFTGVLLYKWKLYFCRRINFNFPNVVDVLRHQHHLLQTAMLSNTLGFVGDVRETQCTWWPHISHFENPPMRLNSSNLSVKESPDYFQLLLNILCVK